MQPVDGGFGLAGKVCVVTGAAGGIGHAVVRALAREGARVAMLDLGGATLDCAAEILRASGADVLNIACDVSSRVSVEEAAAVVEDHLGSAEVLVNCVGIQRRGALDQLDIADWKDLLAVNLDSYFLCAQIFSGGMRHRGEGVLVHISSIQATYPSLTAGAYSASKAGVSMLSRQLAAEWGPLGLRSNVVAPAWVVTPMSAHIYADRAFAEARAARVPLRRIGSPEDSAQAVLFLASPRAAYVNGAELLVDGGLSCNLMSAIRTADWHRDTNRSTRNVRE
jgi:glucose 1-dehydrogenase